MSVEELAKAMYEAASAVAFVGGIGIEEQWECVDQDERDLCEAHAQGAREFFGLPEGAKRGAVGEAVAALKVGCKSCTVRKGCLGDWDTNPDKCPIWAALRALGVEAAE